MRPTAGRVSPPQKRQQAEGVDAVVRPGPIDRLWPPAFVALPTGQMIKGPIDGCLDAHHLASIGDRFFLRRRVGQRSGARHQNKAGGKRRPKSGTWHREVGLRSMLLRFR